MFVDMQECGQITLDGVDSILDCKALEEVLLRHTVSMKNSIPMFNRAITTNNPAEEARILPSKIRISS